MRDRGIERNVHTFSALMNVCIKCGQYKLALEVYRDMQAAVRRSGERSFCVAQSRCATPLHACVAARWNEAAGARRAAWG
jgi:pentatricopeptide repeat protein